MLAYRLKEGLHEKQKTCSGENDPQKSPEKFTGYFPHKTQRKNDQHYDRMRRPIPETQEPNEQKPEDKGQFGQRVELMEDTIAFDVKGETLVHSDRLIRDALIINDTK